MVRCIQNRGPDSQGVRILPHAALGHSRLAILDLDPRANQPMTDKTGRYTLIFNGEIYNFKSLKTELEKDFQIQFRTTSDTEVLLYGLIHFGTNYIQRLNGFFAFAFYDLQEDRFVLVRDRFGIKPLYYQPSPGRFVFASSLNSVMKAIDQKSIHAESLSTYFQLSYIPAPHTILEGVYKLKPAHYLEVSKTGIEEYSYYSVDKCGTVKPPESKQQVTSTFRDLLQNSVEDRLQADVAVGTFLSGGIDSSVITLLASRINPTIPVFSIGFPDQPYFDESVRAATIARHLNVDHHIIELREKDIDEKLHSILEAFDEPFADSSAILVNILCENARKTVKVALSGDGADEIMGGYNKHRALLQSIDNNFTNAVIRASSGLLKHIPESRNNRAFNYLRKAKKYSTGLNKNFTERYKFWAGFTPSNVVDQLLRNSVVANIPDIEPDETNFNSVLKADVELVLPNDMLYKVDLMSMNHSLEARVPYLDHRLVDFLFTLPSEYKINAKGGKIILRNAFKSSFPTGFFEGDKRGFEAPLSYWLRGPLRSIREQYLSETFIEKQGLFNYYTVRVLEKRALGHSPGDTPHTIWALLVFQYWYASHFDLGQS